MNWGKGITIFIATFMLFIASMVFYAFTKDADLVREDYYENELVYDQTKTNKLNYLELNEPVSVAKNQSGIVFQFPESVKPNATGKIIFYRPDQKKYDCEFTLEIDSAHQQILAYKNFKEGYYDLQVEWNDGEKTFLFEDHISF